MSTLPEDFRTLVASTSGITGIVGSTTGGGAGAARIHCNKIPQDSTRENIWFRVAGDTEELTIDKIGGLHEAYLDLECAAPTEGKMQDLAEAVKGAIHGHQGSMGNSSAQGIFLSDKDDSYESQLRQDDGVHVASFDVHLFYTT